MLMLRLGWRVRLIDDSGSNSLPLTVTGRKFLGLSDGSYRWFDLKQFTFPARANLEAHEVIDALLASQEYRDDYLSPDSHERDCGAKHGPYNVERLQPSDFLPITESDFAAVIREFTLLHDQMLELGELSQIDQLSACLVDDDSQMFQLRKLSKDDWHEYGDVLWEFRELLSINIECQSLQLLVMAID